MSLEIRNKRQQEGMQAVVDNDDVGTVMCMTGFGNVFVF
jgi:hypothetical protein